MHKTTLGCEISSWYDGPETAEELAHFGQPPALSLEQILRAVRVGGLLHKHASEVPREVVSLGEALHAE